MPKLNMKNSKLGTLMRDKVTDFVGIAIARIEYLNGCVQFSLKAKIDKDGKVIDAQTFDCEQLEIVNKGLTGKSKKKKEDPPGGIMPDAPIIK